MSAQIIALPQVRPPLHYCGKCERYDSTTVCRLCSEPMLQTSGRMPRAFVPCPDCRSVVCHKFQFCAATRPGGDAA